MGDRSQKTTFAKLCMNRKSKGYVFTLNNYTNEQLSRLREHWNDEVSYICWGKEVAPTTGTEHLQGLVRLQNSYRKTAVLDKFSRILGCPREELTVWIDFQAGTFDQAREYCSKEGEFEEYGERPLGRGKRSDLDEVAERIVGGETIQESISERPSVYVKYYRGLTALGQTLQRPRTERPEVYWFYGPTGTGKSRRAFEEAPNAYWKDSTKWWDGYTNQEAVIIDDYRPNKEMSLHYLLRLFDRYPFQVESKGGYLVMNSTKFYVCVPDRHDVMFGKCDWIGDDKIDQLTRRISKIVHFCPSLVAVPHDVPIEEEHS